MFACACGGSAETTGAGGTSAGGAFAKGSGGASPIGLAGSTGFAGSGGGGNAGGASNTGSMCPAVTPCGGDLVGDWTLKQMCLSPPPTKLLSGCADASITLSPLTATGKVSFKADHTMSSAGVISFTEALRFPTSCYSDIQCTAYAGALSGEPTVTSAQCSYDAITGCSCTVTSSQATMNSGTYEVQGSQVVITSSTTGKAEVDGFCVSGKTATVVQVNANGFSSSMVLTK
ncbi:MAG TPA: hypothetical protein VER04_08420 [Polyangiaceae bacterium]|nr:hypothetical protein [Polyangiaceae bacterium]